MAEKAYLAVEDLDVHGRLCRLHLEVRDLSHQWPAEERYELGSQVRRSSNSSPAQLAEKNDDRHIRNKVAAEYGADTDLSPVGWPCETPEPVPSPDT